MEMLIAALSGQGAEGSATFEQTHLIEKRFYLHILCRAFDMMLRIRISEKI